MLLLDGLDEVPEERPGEGDGLRTLPGSRQRLRKRLEDFATGFPQPRLLVTSRIVGYVGSPVPRAEELELMPFGEDETDAFVRAWFAGTDKARPFLDRLQQSQAVRGLARIPLMLLLLCRSYEREGGKLPARRVDLYRSCLRGLLGMWKGDKQARQIGAAEVEPLLDLLGGVARSLFRSGLQQFREGDLFHRISVWQAENPEHPCGKHDPSDLLRELQQSGAMVRAGDDSESPWLFLHRTFQEYLTASSLASQANQQGWFAIEQLISRNAWLSEWHEVIILLAGELQDPEPLLRLLGDVRKDDVYRHRLALAALCLPELGEGGERCRACVDSITEEAVTLWWQTVVSGINSGYRHLEQAIPALASGPGAVKGTSVPKWCLLRIQFARKALTPRPGKEFQGSRVMFIADDPNRRVCIRAARAVGVMGPAAATPDVLAALLDLALCVSDGDLRSSATEALRALGAAAVTPDVLAALTAALRDPDKQVRHIAARAVGALGSVAVAAVTPDVLAALTAALRDPDEGVKEFATVASGALGAAAATPDVLAALCNLARRDPREFLRTSATEALVPVAYSVRISAIEALGSVAVAAVTPDVLAALTAALRDPEELFSDSTARALRALGAAAATPDVLEALLDCSLLDRGMRWQIASSTLVKMGPAAATPDVLEALTAALRDPARYVQTRADPMHLHINPAFVRSRAIRLSILINSSAVTPDILADLTTALRDPDQNVRMGAVYSLERFGSAAATPDILAALLDLARREPNQLTGVLAASVVVRLNPAATTPDLIKALIIALMNPLKQDLVEGRFLFSTVEAFGCLTPEAVTAVLADLTSLLHEPEAARHSVCAALKRVGTVAATPAVLAALTAALRDPEDLVRYEAGAVLGAYFSQGIRLFAGRRRWWIIGRRLLTRRTVEELASS